MGVGMRGREKRIARSLEGEERKEKGEEESDRQIFLGLSVQNVHGFTP